MPAGQWTKSQAPQCALLALDHEERLAREHEEVLLVVLAVVHRHRFAGAEHREVDPELREVQRIVDAEAFELAQEAAAAAVVPRRVTRIEHEPTVSRGNDPVLDRYELRLTNHRPILPSRIGTGLKVRWLESNLRDIPDRGRVPD